MQTLRARQKVGSKTGKASKVLTRRKGSFDAAKGASSNAAPKAKEGTSQMINVADYWPIPGPGHSITKIFDNNSKSMIVPATGGGAWLEEWVNNKWTDTWHYVNGPRGILEDYDLYPGKKTNMAPGKEIIWGSHQNVGDLIQGQCEISGWGFGIGDQYGWQEVKFLALLPEFKTAAGSFTNVLQIEYWQYWTSMGASGGRVSSGAKIWLDRGIGFLRQEWSKNGVPTGFGQALQSYSIA